MNNLNKFSKKILIPGGAGYIGSMLATELVHLGHQVTVIDILKYNKTSLNHLLFYENFKLVKKNILKIRNLKKIIKNYEYIIPLAGLVGAPLCEKNKKEAIELNYKFICKLINNLNSKHKIIYPTTNSGYGVGKKNKFCDENSELNPVSLYGRTKVDAEKEILKVKNSVSFRLATVFGFSYRLRSDLMVNNFVYTALRVGRMTMFEPHFRRNFIHIRDVVKAFIFTINNFNKMKGNSYNLGLSSANITKIQLAKKIKKHVKKFKIKVNNFKKDPDQRDYFVSNKKIEKKGFKAQITLEQGIKELVEIFSISDEQSKNY
tara:strand:- start:393 stop:1346 length:954 start_codon:yes stop_codon:yes gene_type:complete